MIYITWSINDLYMIYIIWYMDVSHNQMVYAFMDISWSSYAEELSTASGFGEIKKTVHPSVVRLLRQEMEDPPPHRGNPAAELSWALTIHQLLIVLYHQAFIIYTLW